MYNYYFIYLHVKIMEFATFHAKQILCISPSSPHGINNYGLCLYLFKK